MHTNRLIGEKSPYLLQHAHNPVDWRPWGDEAFAKARLENKPIFLSVGYSTCHWCHVMERESFESDEIAALLNRHFVPVKVDREERPDVDRVYMLFVQATTGSGGWPMSVFLTPDLKPFFGGTYFPPADGYGRPGFRSVLERIAQAWAVDGDRIRLSGDGVVDQLRSHLDREAPGPIPGEDALESAFLGFRRVFDPQLGGFGGAPKFPRPAALDFLFRYSTARNQPEAAGMALSTLRAMARGGMRDQLGGGFHRYSVDERWHVPHFEKMLYDQAQLTVSYLEAFQLTGDPFYADVARDTLDYVLRDMTHPEGGFYSAEDADSVIDPARPEEKGEGAFYLWTRSEIDLLLGQPAAQWFCHRFGVEEGGNVLHDPHGEFEGQNILFEAHTLQETAAQFGAPIEQLAACFENSRRLLLSARAGRTRPHLDDKVLAGWNGLMISAFARAAQALSEPRYREAARRAMDFVTSRMLDPAGGRLQRRFRDGAAGIPAFLEDYAFLVRALLDLYETEFRPGDLELAATLAGRQRELFEDPSGGCFISAADAPDLVLRLKDDYDGAEPSGNSVTVVSLLKLAAFTGRSEFRDAAEAVLRGFASRLRETPTALPAMLAGLMLFRDGVREIRLAGAPDSADTRAMLAELRGRLVPDAAVMPAGAGYPLLEGRATAYVCRNTVCQLPVNQPEAFVKLLQ